MKLGTGGIMDMSRSVFTHTEAGGHNSGSALANKLISAKQLYAQRASIDCEHSDQVQLA